MTQLRLTVLFLLPLAVLSQSMANYTSTRNTSITYNSIASTGSSFGSWRNATTNTQDDNRSDFTNIGFDFWYGGVRYTQFCVSTNGFLDFSSSTDDGGPQADDFGYDNTAFTAANAANATRPAIAPFYDDLTAQGGTGALGNALKYQLSGTAPNRTLTIEWINMAVYQNTTPSLNFQVQLLENSGRIIINYGTMTNGTKVFSYSMGLNGTTMSNIPTAAQLKELQAANGNSFSNTVQNGLVTIPTGSTQYIFTPPAPTTTSGSLTFSGVSQTGMTLNWTNWASNEVGYVIYQSTDNVNFFFATQTAANATSASITGLLPATTYYWKLYAVTEGNLGSPINGTQATASAGNKVSTGTGNWNTAATWSPSGVPSAGDNVTIANGHVVTIDVAAVCNSLYVGQGTSGTLQFSSGLARSLTVNSNLTVNSGGAFMVNSSSTNIHSVLVLGNVVNNGTVNLYSSATAAANITFSRPGNQTISGTGPVNKYAALTVGLGSSTDVFEITASNFSLNGALTLNTGIFKVSTVNTVNLTIFPTQTTLGSNCTLWLNSSNLQINTGAGINLYGDIIVTNGNLVIGNAQDEGITAFGGSIVMDGGSMTLSGNLDGSGINNVCDFNLNGGTIYVNWIGSTSTGVAPFHIAGAGSQCNMTGGKLVIQNAGGTGGGLTLGFINTGTSGAIVTGGTLQIGNSLTSGSQTIDINTDAPITNLSIVNPNVTARLNTNALTVVNNISSAGILNANNLGITLGGNWTNSGTFIPGTGTVTFNGTTSQTITHSGGETFNTLVFTGAGTKTFANPVTCNGTFSVGSGSSVDVSASNHLLSVKGNFINHGTFNARSGLLLLNGTSTQIIGGVTTTDFYDITLNNTAGLTLGHSENLKGSLTLSNGIFNANGNVFTLISDANGTGRIAAISGTGDYSGNITSQRYAPGGTTGWAFLGSPLSSALTMSDWDDDIYISCPSCPDGSAAGFLSIYSYSEAATGAYNAPGSYIGISAITDPIVAGKGYWVYLGNGQYTTTAITIDVTGTPRKFNYTIPLSYSNYGSAANDGWNLICNPYPSPISWASLKGSTTGIDNAIYVYNADLNGGSGGYATYVNGVSSPAVASGGIGDNIPIGQGFYVHSTGATGLNATESIKVSGNPTFLKNAAPSIARIQLKSYYGAIDETVLYMTTGATNSFDKACDSYKMKGQDPYAPMIALDNTGELFQVNGVAPITGNFSMPMRVVTGYAGTYSIGVNDLSAFPSSACIHLYDTYTGISTDLRTNEYTFALSDTTTSSRFMLNITLNALAASSVVAQPTCKDTAQGKIIAVGKKTGPWDYKWSVNNVLVKTTLNHMGSDSLYNLSGGTVDLEMNTTGGCDLFEATVNVLTQQPVKALFASVDSVMLPNGNVIFTNQSSNALNSFWNFGVPSSTSSVTSPTFVYQQAGQYTVTLLAESISGCADSVSKVIKVITDPTGISKNMSSDWRELHIGFNHYQFVGDNSTAEKIQWTLVDMSGRTVIKTGECTTAPGLIDVQLPGAGMYMLMLKTPSKTTVYKLLSE